jgi:hypothetical protein
MDILFLKICGIAAGLVGLVILSVNVIRRSTKFLSQEDQAREDRANGFFRLRKVEDEEELFL